MVRPIAVCIALAACSPALPSGIPCDTNQNCPKGLGCNLTAQVCVEIPGCGDNNNGGGCFSGSPQDPTVSYSGGKVTLTWFAGNTPNNASGFAVLRSEAQTGPFATVGTVTPYSLSQQTFTDLGPFTPGKIYWYAVATSWPSNVVGQPSGVKSVGIPHWNEYQPMPTARYTAGAAAVGGIIYVIGGWTNGNLEAAVVEAYDPSSNTWSTKAPMPTARAALGVAAVNGIIYAIGGTTNCNCGTPPILATVEAYDPVANTWSTKASIPTARRDMALGAIGGVLYVAGGANNAGPLPTVEAYDPVANTWSTKAPLASAREGAAAAVLGGKLHVVGGVDQSAVRLGLVDAYDPVANSWASKPAMPTPRQWPSVGVLGSLLFAAGGTPGSGAYKVTEAFDPAANAWTTLEPAPYQMGAAASAVVGNVFFVIGGFTNAQQTNIGYTQ